MEEENSEISSLINSSYVNSSVVANQTGFFDLLKQFPVWSTTFCMSSSLMVLTWREPILEPRLKKDDLSVLMIGVFFSIDTVFYTLTSYLLNNIKEENKNFDLLIINGCFVGFLSMILTAPAPYLFPDSLAIMSVGILLAGSAGALCNNNCVPALTKILEKERNVDKSILMNNISAIATGGFGLGSILGPILAGLFQDYTDFRWSFTLGGCIVLIAGVLKICSVR